MTKRAPILPLSADIAMKIAAGEVIERPASAVKELIDNALDAGASAVRIEVRDAGLKLLRVTDDGYGIPDLELPLAFESHATSKIHSIDDLQRLTTLGFRGEALPSIAAVSRVEVRSAVPGADLGGRIVVEHGRMLEHGRCGTPQGVRITVAELFGNVPARRTFVRSLRSESSQIASVVMQYALSQPGVRFDLEIDGRATFHSPGSGSMRDAAAAVFGADTVNNMVPARHERDGIAVDCLVSLPSLSRQNRSGIFVAVNGRPVANRSLGFALEQAYSGYLMTGRHPVAVAHLRIEPHEVDVNIHPSKSEVRFAREREVHGELHRTVAGALLDARIEARAVTADDEAPIAETTILSGSSLPFMEGASNVAELLPDVPLLRVFGQAGYTFIVAEGPSGLYMIDQHAAHERVLFDELDLQTQGGSPAIQPLLEPLSLELTPEQMAALEQCGNVLSAVGFTLEAFGDSSCLIRAVPVLPRAGSPAELVAEVLGELSGGLQPDTARERALAALACKAAIKAGQALDVQEMRELVEQLERTARPATCPHGRPTMIHMSHAQLERQFGRR